MRWLKHGRIFAAPTHLDWVESHASVPCVLPLDEERVRVYFSARDRGGRSHVGWFDLDLLDPGRTLDVSETPVLSPGPLGSYDESGAMASWVLRADGTVWMYTIGWTLGVTVPFYNSVGLARSDDGGATFEKVSEGPLFSRDRIDPYFTASSCVLRDGPRWRMWYLSCTGWTPNPDGPRHHYHIRHATSDDGQTWARPGTVCIDYGDPGEYAISRPSVIRDSDRYRMWYSRRGELYRIGYAESDDGLAWRRMDDQAGIDVSPEGWDAQMIEYPCVFDHRGRRWMLYNGDGYGATGIGLAELVEND
jgi:hypothetical protein